MRDLKDYSRREWFRNKPMDHFLVDICNDALQGFFKMWKPGVLDRFLQDVEHLKGQNIGLVVAFQQPWVLDWLLRSAERQVTDGTLLVFDNSRRKESRPDIERVCREHGTPYLPLPPNPTKHPNRSHGMAMSWIFHNVVRNIRPKTFTYIDHDLIPMDRVNLGEALGEQHFYGLPNVAKWGWSIWAGYCSYNFPLVKDLPLNFLNDFSRGLDTGGRNWSCLYKQFDRSRLHFASHGRLEITNPADGALRVLTTVDNCWVHLGGAGYGHKFQKAQDFYKLIAAATDRGATLETLATKEFPPMGS